MSRRQSPPEKTKSKASASPSATDNEQRYCICQKREDELNEQESNDFMIECDGCNGWFHGKCIGLADRIADDIEKYFCAQCSYQHGSSIFKPRRNQHRRDFSDGNADNKATQSGTPDFIQKLKRKVFPSSEPVITRMNGHQLTADHLAKVGFNKPILITNRDGLDLALPSRTITLAEIHELVGPDRSIDIIDCEKQVTYKMGLDEYIEYFESIERNKVYNVLSLEISNTKLGEQVATPRIVRELSWATIGVWPEKKGEEENDDEGDLNDSKERKATWSLQTSSTALSSKKKRRTISSDADQTDEDDEDYQAVNANHFENFERPEVAKYCLISPQSSYTDFHVDFGGSSVWYSVVRGEKIFYIIEPTDENLQKYADWSKSPSESETFLGDCVSHCYKMHLREENTVFIPAGWIHAVYTVTDSLVFGGNFLQSMGVDMQLRIYELERFAQVPHKFQFPLFETFHWYAAKSFYEELKAANESDVLIFNPITQQACESMVLYMNKWLINDRRYQIRNRQIIPKGINCEKLLRDLARELDLTKARCGSSHSTRPPSISIVASPIKVILPLDSKQELVHFNNTKIKVKCRRISTDPESSSQSNATPAGKMKQGASSSGMKLTIKTSLSGCRKPADDRQMSPIMHKKKTSRATPSAKQTKSFTANDTPSTPEELPRVTYTLDLEAKRQRFIEPTTMQLNNSQSDSDDNHSSSDTNGSSLPAESTIDTAEPQDDNQESIGGLASFVKSSTMHHDSYHANKDAKIKRERSTSDPKLLPSKKSKSSTPIEGAKLHKTTKKIKAEVATTPSSAHRKKPSTPSTPTASPSIGSAAASASGPANIKKRLSTSPKKGNSKDRLGKILKIANSIKSRGGILT